MESKFGLVQVSYSYSLGKHSPSVLLFNESECRKVKLVHVTEENNSAKGLIG